MLRSLPYNLTASPPRPTAPRSPLHSRRRQPVSWATHVQKVKPDAKVHRVRSAKHLHLRWLRKMLVGVSKAQPAPALALSLALAPAPNIAGNLRCISAATGAAAGVAGGLPGPGAAAFPRDLLSTSFAAGKGVDAALLYMLLGHHKSEVQTL